MLQKPNARGISAVIALAALLLAQAVGLARVAPPDGSITQSTCSAAPTDGLEALWRGDGSYNDDFGRSGAHVGGVTFGQGVDGRQAFVFDGTGIVWMQQFNGDGDLYPAGSFSVAAWIKSSDTTHPGQVIAEKYDCGGFCPAGANSEYVLALNDGVLAATLRDTAGVTSNIVGHRTLTDGQFHHVALVRDLAANELRLYADGTRDAVLSLTGGATGVLKDDDGSLDPFEIGAHHVGGSDQLSDHFTGTIADVAYYSRALTDADAFNWVCAIGNHAPTAVNDSATTQFQTAIDVAVLGNDTDADADALSVSHVTQGGHGSVSINSDGTVRYTPAFGFAGSDTFSYTIDDGRGGTATATVTVTVASLNACVLPPTDGLIGRWPGNGSTLDVFGTRDGVLHDGVSYGPGPHASTSAFLLDGTTGYVDVTAPTDNDLYSTGSFSIVAGVKTSVSSRTQTIVSRYECGGYNCGGNTMYYLYVDSGKAAAYLRDNDGNATAITGTRFIADGQFHQVIVTRDLTVNEARLYVDGTRDATVSLTGGGATGALRDGDGKPDPFIIGAFRPYGSDTTHVNFLEGSIADVAYFGRELTDVDAHALAASAAPDCTPTNHAPVAADDSATTVQDTAIDIALLANDTDEDNDVLHIAGVAPSPHGAVVTIVGNVVHYMPAFGFVGVDRFSYRLSDGVGGISTATVTVTVNERSIYVPGFTDLGEPVGNIYGNWGLKATGVNNAGQVVGHILHTNLPGGGYATHSFLYAGGVMTDISDFPASNNSANAINNAGQIVGQSDPGYWRAWVRQPNGVFNYYYAPQGPYNFGNAYAINSSGAIGGVSNTGQYFAGGSYGAIAQPGGGTWTLIDGLVPDAAGPYGNDLQVAGINDSGAFIGPLNHSRAFLYIPGTGPVDIGSLGHGSAGGYGVIYYGVIPRGLNNSNMVVGRADTDDGYNHAFSYTQATGMVDIGIPGTYSIATAVSDTGVIVGSSTFPGKSGNRAFVYTPASGMQDLNDLYPGFGWTLQEATAISSDGHWIVGYGVSPQGATHAFRIALTAPAPPNHAPLAVDDAATTLQDTAIDVNVLANDSDADHDALSVTNVTQGAHGATVTITNGQVHYLPATGFRGADTFTYAIDDGHGGTASAAVTVTVEQVIAPLPPGATVTLGPNLLGDPSFDNSFTVKQTCGAAPFFGGSWLAFAQTHHPFPSITMTAHGGLFAGEVQTTSNQDCSGGYFYQDLDLPAQSFDLSAWVYPISGSQRVSLLFGWDHVGAMVGSANIVIDPTATRFDAWGGGGVAAPLTYGHWHQVRLLGDAASSLIHLFVDGVEVGTAAMGQPQPFSWATVLLGQPSRFGYGDASGAALFGPDDFVYDDVSLATAQIRLPGVGNHAPVAIDDAAMTLLGTATDIAVLDNDTDVDGDTLTVTSVTQGSHGATITIVGGHVHYLPASGFSGSDEFTYTVGDAYGGTAAAKVTVDVSSQAPVIISIGNVTKAEGTGGTTPFVFPVTLSSASTLPVTVYYQVGPGTATAGDFDYFYTNGTLTFTPGQTSQTITVDVVGDSRIEPDETFMVALSSPTNATIADGSRPTLTQLARNLQYPNGGMVYRAVTNDFLFSEPLGGRILKMDAATGAVSVFADVKGMAPANPGGYLYDIAVDSHGDVFAPAYDQGPILHFNASGIFLGTIPTLSHVYGAAFDSQDNLFVVMGDSNPKTSIYRYAAGFLDAPTVYASGFNLLTAIRFNAADQLIANDFFAGTVYRVTPGGMTAASHTALASGLSRPDGLAIDPQTQDIFAADDVGGAIIKIATTGEVSTFLAGLGADVSPDSGRLQSMGFDHAGHLYVADKQSGVIWKLGPPAGGIGVGTIVNDDIVINHVPVAVDDTATTTAYEPIQINVIANDVDADGDPLTVTGVTPGAHGSTVIVGVTDVLYVPAPGFVGVDTFTYSVSDGRAGSPGQTATVTVSVAATTPALFCAVPEPGLVSWWPAEGSALDFHGSNPGTIQGGVSFVSGPVGQAFHFNGTDGIVTVPAANNLNPVHALSIDAWVNPEQWGASNGIGIGVIAGRPFSYQMDLLGDGTVRFGLITGGVVTPWVDSAIPLRLNAWTHVTGVYDGAAGLLTLYFDGVIQGQVAAPAQIDSVMKPFQIGGFDDPGFTGGFFAGAIDEVRLYSRALTLSEIQGLQAGPPCPLPVISISNVTRAEGNGGTTPFTFDVTLSNPSSQPVSVFYITVAGTATAGDLDYFPANGTLTFAPGETAKTVAVDVVSDMRVEPDEFFTVVLGSPANAVIAGGGGIGTIVNDDLHATTTTLSVTPNPGTIGQAVTLAATVAVVAPDTGVPTGTVTFAAGATTLGSATLGADGTATLTTTTLDVGSHALTASYDGAASYASSQSQLTSITIVPAPAVISIAERIVVSDLVQAVPSVMLSVVENVTVLDAVDSRVVFTPTTLGLTATPDRPLPGDPVTLVATVSPTGPSGFTPSGTVTFRWIEPGLPPWVLGTQALAGGVASLSQAFPSGPHQVVADYSGDAAFAPSTSPEVTVLVNPAPRVFITSTTASPAHTPSVPMTISFSERVTRLWRVLVSGGTISGFTPVPDPVTGGSKYNFTLTPTAAAPTTVFVEVPALAVKGISGNENEDTRFTMEFVPNHSPVAQAQSVTLDEDTTASFMLTGTDADGDPLSFSIFRRPAHGTVTWTGADARYTPAANYSGPDSFQFTASDGMAVSAAPATVTFMVNPVNDPPVLPTVAPRTNAEGQNVSFNIRATDVDGDSMTFSAVGLPPGINIATQSAVPANGTPAAPPPPTTIAVIYGTPTYDSAGTYSPVITANDGHGGIATTTFVWTITNTNRAPTAAGQTLSVAEDSPLTITLTGADPDGDPITFVVKGGPSRGTITQDGAQLTYQPKADFNGTDSITFAANDGTLSSANATVTITVTPVNDPPVFAPSPDRTTREGQAVSFNVRASDIDSARLSFSAVGLPPGISISRPPGLPANISPSYTVVSGTPTFDAAGTYSPVISVDDGQGGTASTTFQWTILESNRAPVAQDGALTLAEDTEASIALSATDPDGDALTYAIARPPRHGRVSLNGAAATFTPDADYAGADSFTFRANDGTLNSAAATVTITVTPVNDLPVLPALAPRTTPEAHSVSFNVRATDVDGDSLTFSAVGLPPGINVAAQSPVPVNGTPPTPPPPTTVAVVYGTPTYDAAGTYTPVITANDGHGGIASTTFTWTITNTNRAPTAGSQSVSVAEDTPLTITLTGSDPDGDALSYVVKTGPSRGTVTQAGAQLTYQPAPNFNGIDVITFAASDGTLSSANATVTITVTPVNDAPVFAPQPDRTTREGQAVSFNVRATDVDGIVMDFVGVGLPPGISLSTVPAAPGNNSPAYAVVSGTPTYDAAGLYVPVIFVSDGQGGMTSTSFQWTITNTNRPPTAGSQTLATPKNTPLTITLTGADPDGDAITFAIGRRPAHGTVIVSGASVTYTPAANYTGTDSFTFTTNDGSASSTAATIAITVTP